MNDEIVVGTYDRVAVHARTANGNASPVRTILGDSTGIAYATGVALDPVKNEIFVANNRADANSVTVFARTARGNTAPLRTISGGATRLNGPLSVAVNVSDGELFVGGENNSITVYNETANGNVAPLRAIGGSQSLSGITGIAVSPGNDEVFVASGGNNAIVVFAAFSDGNAAPLRTIAGANTGLSRPASIAVDVLNKEIYVANAGSTGGTAGASITVYASTADGDSAPLRTIAGPNAGLYDQNGTSRPIGIIVDKEHDELLVAILLQSNIIPVMPAGSILAYRRTANGNVTPLRKASGLSLMAGVAFSPTSDEIFVGKSSSAIEVYARNANGIAVPLRTISGDATNLFGPTGIAVDTANREVFVANYLHFLGGDYAITVYGAAADGNVAPIRTITGRGSGLNFPGAIAVAGK